ncbi:hypothetical protein X928_08495 [Petrotoga miotherma DSM 10691]|uniref:Uncharacterized protein n=1 Tax=Petrotoga miotherma DSM 10691 TaxID=1434326 RepID=A0A2K1P879_9BACT|nr:hypothetical protein X928_08495 [Petrotoga miotherma DSM 10691]
MSETSIQRLAEGRNLAVVMPSGNNSFYLDQPESGNFGILILKKFLTGFH